jgi:hypothetical protein
MRKISIAFLAAASLAGLGCHKDKEKASDSIAKLTELKDKMCACKSKTCSDKVSAELAQWGQDEEKFAGDKPASLSEKATEKVEALKEETANCLLRIEVPSGAGASGTAGGTVGSGSPATGSADGSSSANGGVGSAATGSAGGSEGSAAAGSAR